MVNYALGKIYKVVNDVNNIVYIGSTAQKMLSFRMRDHRMNSTLRDSRFYTAMKEIGANHFSIVLICSHPCLTKDELEAQEYKIIEETKANGQQVYNSITMIKNKHTHSEETKAKCVASQRLRVATAKLLTNAIV